MINDNIAATNYEPKSDTVFVTFNIATGQDKPEKSRMQVRAGICWPINVTVTDRHEIKGAVVVGMRDTESMVMKLVHEFSFQTVPNRADEGGFVRSEGMAPEFTKIASRYHCMRYYFQQPEYTHKQYRLQVRRSASVHPQPRFTKVEWDEEEDVEAIMADYGLTRKLRIPEKSQTMLELKTHRGNPAGGYPFRRALLCLVAGMSKHRRWVDEEDERILLHIRG